MLAGAGSGVVFAALMAFLIALSRIDVGATGAFLGASALRVERGPELVRGTILAAVWGVAGGAIGGLVAPYVGAGTGTMSE